MALSSCWGICSQGGGYEMRCKMLSRSSFVLVSVSIFVSILIRKIEKNGFVCKDEQGIVFDDRAVTQVVSFKFLFLHNGYTGNRQVIGGYNTNGS